MLSGMAELASGRRSGVATACGVALGQALWTVAAAAGVVAVLARERVGRAFEAVTGVVLVALGLRVAAARG